MTRLLMTEGQGRFEEVEWSRPEIKDDEIAVRAVMTGVCRSDIDMMVGRFGPLPLHMQGHEGLGQVIEVGSAVKDVGIGDFVATRGEPAYADEYNVKPGEYVVVPEAEPKFILEPVACGINVVTQPLSGLLDRAGPGQRLLILGSGFLAWVAYHTIMLNELDFEVTVVGNSNQDLWGNLLSSDYEGAFDAVIDLSSRDDVFTRDILRPNALVIMGVEKPVSTSFSNLLWKACTMVFPSPRTPGFHACMQDAAWWIANGDIEVDSFWTAGYNRDTNWQSAFADGLNRPQHYSRGYIYWN